MSGNIELMAFFSASRDECLHDQPRSRMRLVASRTFGTSPVQPRSPPGYMKRTEPSGKPTHSTASSADFADGDRVSGGYVGDLVTGLGLGVRTQHCMRDDVGDVHVRFAL